MGRRNDHPAVWSTNVYFDRLGIIQWDITKCSLQNYFENKIPFTKFLAKFPFKIILDYLLFFIIDSLRQAGCPTSNKLVVVGNVHTFKYGAILKEFEFHGEIHDLIMIKW